MLISFLLTLLVHNSILALSTNLIIAIPLFSGVFAYLVFYFLLKGFIQYRLSLIYRSIQIKQPENITFAKSIDSLMEDAEKNVAEWKENSSIEISKLKEQAAFRNEFLGNYSPIQLFFFHMLNVYQCIDPVKQYRPHKRK